MLTKLLPDQISKFWDVIKFAVEQSLPPIAHDHPDKMNRILSSLLCGKTDCWVSHKSEKFESVMLTKILYDDASNTRNLLIYCLYGYEIMNNESWSSGLETLLKYAKGKKCNQIISYTELPNMIELANKLGAETKYTFISFDI